VVVVGVDDNSNKPVKIYVIFRIRYPVSTTDTANLPESKVQYLFCFQSLIICIFNVHVTVLNHHMTYLVVVVVVHDISH
jgi:hypothetical protein